MVGAARGDDGTAADTARQLYLLSYDRKRKRFDYASTNAIHRQYEEIRASMGGGF